MNKSLNEFRAIGREFKESAGKSKDLDELNQSKRYFDSRIVKFIKESPEQDRLRLEKERKPIEQESESVFKKVQSELAIKASWASADALEAILVQAEEGATKLKSFPEFESFKAQFVGSQGKLTQIAKGIGKLSAQERPKVGKLVNQTKKQLEALLEKVQANLEAQAMADKMGPPLDPTLPSADGVMGRRHPLTQVRHQINDIFCKVGFTIAEGPEVESEWYCFDALNTPEDHPARDVQDTLYCSEDVVWGNIDRKKDERYILRTQTSSVQIRSLLKASPPLRIISPGRAFRRDTVDATHSANFHQIEGLYIDKAVSVKDLKAILDYFVQALFGKAVKTRFRPSFFPFTEPSFEMDLNAPNLGKLSGQWIEILGCGLVDPEVLKSVEHDPDVWTGYAFGMGIERVAMILYQIDDIRYFYQNDLRFLKQFS